MTYYLDLDLLIMETLMSKQPLLLLKYDVSVKIRGVWGV